MRYTGIEGPPIEKYSDYKNRTREKFINRYLELLNGIKQSSLKPEDKEKLKQHLKKL